jgi:ribosomal protein L3 glutamine methyltransferase
MTIAEWIERVTREFEAADLCFGHGTDNARDEAAWLVLHVAGAPLDGSFDQWGRVLDPGQAEQVRRLSEQRRATRQPLAYLLNSAWFAGLEFEVSPAVLVPRSPLAELIRDGFRPWVRPDRVMNMLDLCTGSGCIAVASALRLQKARVDASDVSPAALEVAARNVRRHGVEDRVRLIRSDLFAAIPEQPYDLITANPPYVPAPSLERLPAEYRAEPGLGLASGGDGLDAVLNILVDSPAYLGEDGILVCEVGESEQRLADALPRLPFLWLEFEHGGSGVFVLTRQQLLEAAVDLAELMGKRKHVT